MKPKIEAADVGIIVGRFQIDSLHRGHRQLIEYVRQNHERVIIVLGSHPVPGHAMNPLPYSSRAAMIIKEYPDVEIARMFDCKFDVEWSMNLDRLVASLLFPHQTAILYGSRESFIEHYNGTFQTLVLEGDGEDHSATLVRNRIIQRTRASEDFNAGVIWGCANRFPHAVGCVDVAPYYRSNYRSNVVLGSKRSDRSSSYRFFGGFVDPSIDESLELAAMRELSEETSHSLSHGGVKSLEYICSQKIYDWRYKGDKDQVMTSFFAIQLTHLGTITHGDDIDSVEVAPIDDRLIDIVIPEHKYLAKQFVKYMKEKQND